VLKIILLVFLFTSFSTLACNEKNPPIADFIKSDRFKITGPFDVQTLEERNMIENRTTGNVVPFGYANELWVKFKSQIKDGDQIYFFINSEPGFYQNGHFLVRNGCIIDMFNGSIS